MINEFLLLTCKLTTAFFDSSSFCLPNLHQALIFFHVSYGSVHKRCHSFMEERNLRFCENMRFLSKRNYKILTENAEENRKLNFSAIIYLSY